MDIIRHASGCDLAAIVDIYNSTIAGRMVTADTEEVSVESRRGWFNDHSPDFRPLYVVERNSEIVGWLSFQSFYGRPAYNGTAEISIYIRSEFRKTGLGNTLIQKAIDESSRLNIKTLLGFIFGHNIPSLKLFYKFGFTNWAMLPGVAELDGIERDLIIVGKKMRQ
jgi:L-amino acid N-acyltransferase YncA